MLMIARQAIDGIAMSHRGRCSLQCGDDGMMYIICTCFCNDTCYMQAMRRLRKDEDGRLHKKISAGDERMNS